MRVTTITGALALLATVFAISAAAAPPPLVVDDNGVQCPNAGYTTIQGAVAAAPSGATITVCPGNYYGAVSVDKPLRLVGPENSAYAQSNCMTSNGDDDTKDAIVHGGASTPGFIVNSDGVRISGFTIRDASGDAGIRSYHHQGVWLSSNIVEENTIGIAISGGSSSSGNLIQRNCIRNNNVSGSSAGTGIYSDGGLKYLTVSRNTFTGQQNGGILLLAPSNLANQHITITRNSSVNDASFIFANMTDSSVNRNTMSTISGSGMYFAGGDISDDVSFNSINGCDYTGLNFSFSPVSGGGSYDVTLPNAAGNVVGNTVSSCADAGIRVRFGAVNFYVYTNTVSGNGDGIAVEDNSTHNTVRQNISTNNTNDGFFADTDSSQNLFFRNTANGNANRDCEDISTGSGTAGTANTWTRNKGMTASPTGICTPRGR